MKKFLKLFVFIVLIGAVVAAIWGYPTYQSIYGINVPENLEENHIMIPTGSDYEEVVRLLSDNGFIKDESSFRKAASLMKFDQRESMRAGRYEIESGTTNRALIKKLRSGKQAPVMMTISYGRLPEDVAGKASKYIEADSQGILVLFERNEFLKEYGLTRETAISYIIPNSYEFFWNTDEVGFWKRMAKEHKAFWNEDRLAKAKKINLTPEEVYTLASIVEGETNYNPEKKRVAGVYVNRLKINMPLQADPTLKFATRDFEAKRVLNKHKEFDSPYNTYMYGGLPPGPIMLASITSIDAVLNYENHKYLYFCAKPPKDIVNGKPSEHAFAKNLKQHNANAQRYYKYLRAAGIR
jgi:UPF0755 protein